MVRTGKCAYCGDISELTGEHMLPGALRGPEHEGVSVFPSTGKHRLGGQLVLHDVCGACNSGPLGQLDEFVARWSKEDAKIVRDPRAPLMLTKWCAKMALNAERSWEAGLGCRKQLPTNLPKWVVSRTSEAPEFSACLTWIPSGHIASGELAFAFTLDERILDGIVHVREWLFLLAWNYPGAPTDVQSRIRELCDYFPATALDVSEELNPRRIPRMRDPDWLLRGLKANSVYEDLQEGRRRKLAQRGSR
jgi:hypothetical protein